VLIDEFEAFPLGDTVDVLDALGYGPQVWITPDTDRTDRVIREEDEKPPRYEGVCSYTGY
jgi:hypothetical protein